MFRQVLVGLAVMAAAAVSGAACDDDDGSGTPDARTTPPDGGVRDSSADAPATADSAQADGRDGPSGEGGQSDAGSDASADTAPLSELEQRGKYLVENVIACPECHTPRLLDGRLDMSKYMAGDTACFAMIPNSTDCIYTKNLTPHATGLGNRSAEEIKKMIAEGVRLSSSPDPNLHPIMPYYVFGNTDPEDLDAIVAFLKTLPPVENAIPQKGLGWVVPTPAPKIDMDNVPLPATDYPNLAAATRGRYLTTQIGLCAECHTKHLMAGPTALDETKFLQGGEEFPLVFGPVMLTARSKNLTPDMATGLGTWTVDDIVKVLKQGKDKMDKGICPPMPAGPMSSYGGLTNQDARDIAHYLKSIAPEENMVVDMCTFPPGT